MLPKNECSQNTNFAQTQMLPNVNVAQMQTLKICNSRQHETVAKKQNSPTHKFCQNTNVANKQMMPKRGAIICPHQESQCLPSTGFLYLMSLVTRLLLEMSLAKHKSYSIVFNRPGKVMFDEMSYGRLICTETHICYVSNKKSTFIKGL